MSRISAALLCLLLGGCGGAPDGKVHVSYWEKWTGAEGEAMQKVVDQFNRRQDKIVVEYLGISDLARKTLIATAGGDPPDVAGIWLANTYTFADLNALRPLDDSIRGEGTTPEKWAEQYDPVYGDMGVYRGVTWAVPSTPSVAVLYWNKAMFRAAGLDPEHPPRTLAELDDMAEKLTKRDPQTGHVTHSVFCRRSRAGLRGRSRNGSAAGSGTAGRSPSARRRAIWNLMSGCGNTPRSTAWRRSSRSRAGSAISRRPRTRSSPPRSRWSSRASG